MMCSMTTVTMPESRADPRVQSVLGRETRLMPLATWHRPCDPSLGAPNPVKVCNRGRSVTRDVASSLPSTFPQRHMGAETLES